MQSKRYSIKVMRLTHFLPDTDPSVVENTHWNQVGTGGGADKWLIRSYAYHLNKNFMINTLLG